MGFDVKGFMTAKLSYRTETVPVPDIAGWFTDAAPEWTVRGLTGKELGRVNDAAQRNARWSALMEKFASRSPKKMAGAVQDLVDGPDTPEDIARRVEMLVMGSVDPACDLQLSLKMCEHFPVVFHQLTNKILALTGLGAVAGGSKPSGGTPA